VLECLNGSNAVQFPPGEITHMKISSGPMTFDRLSLPTQEDLLDPPTLRLVKSGDTKKPRMETLDYDELGKLLEQFGYHQKWLM